MTLACDKCGELVPPENDAVELERVLHPYALGLLFAQRRHLLPTENCPGSPSRAQYLEGQPRDTREEYPYLDVLEGLTRRAYARLLARVV